MYPGAPHGVTDTHKEQLCADLLAFVQGAGDNAAAAATPETAALVREAPEVGSVGQPVTIGTR